MQESRGNWYSGRGTHRTTVSGNRVRWDEPSTEREDEINAQIDKNPKVQAERKAASKARLRSKPGGIPTRKDGSKVFESIVEYLYVEGYADSIGGAELMAENISESWINSILSEGYKEIDQAKHSRMYDRYTKLRKSAMKDARETGEASGENRRKMGAMSSVLDKSASNLRNKNR